MQDSILKLAKNRFRKLILCFPFNPNKVSLVDFESLTDNTRDNFYPLLTLGSRNKRSNFWTIIYNDLSEFGKLHDTGEKFLVAVSPEPLIHKFVEFAKSIAFNITKCEDDSVSLQYVSKSLKLLLFLLFLPKNNQPIYNISEDQNTEFNKYFMQVFGLNLLRSMKDKLFKPKEYFDYVNGILKLLSESKKISFDGNKLLFGEKIKKIAEKEVSEENISDFQMNNTLEIEKGLVFILMAMNKEEYDDLDDILRSTKMAVDGIRNIDGTKFDPNRINDFLTIPKITPAILENIRKAEYIIANITHKKPNVFYEIGYAHAFDKKTIITAKKGTKVDFDIKDCPIDFYENFSDMETKIKNRLKAFVKEKKKKQQKLMTLKSK